MNITAKQIIIGVAVTLIASIIAFGANALDKRWDQRDTAMTAESNEVTIYKVVMQGICEKYGMNFPCDTSPMNAQDKGRYNFYKQQYDNAQRKLDKRMGKV